LNEKYKISRTDLFNVLKKLYPVRLVHYTYFQSQYPRFKDEVVPIHAMKLHLLSTPALIGGEL